MFNQIRSRSGTGHALRSQLLHVTETEAGSAPSLYIPLPVPGVLEALRCAVKDGLELVLRTDVSEI